MSEMLKTGTKVSSLVVLLSAPHYDECFTTQIMKKTS
jgi:hypothetical protein